MLSPNPNKAVQELRSRLSHNLRRLRSGAGLAQERLALEAGVDRTMLSKIERRVANPSLETLLKLSQRLGVDIIELLSPVPVGDDDGHEPEAPTLESPPVGTPDDPDSPIPPTAQTATPV